MFQDLYIVCFALLQDPIDRKSNTIKEGNKLKSILLYKRYECYLMKNIVHHNPTLYNVYRPFLYQDR